ncbi:amidase domain-containing protein [Clostridium sp. AL.422]|uniref:amidase domain-containing protein n=1 Tax=Clostridium TaxID=1485 RepID=UPI00293DC2DA|nr:MULTISPECIES: amidase domain-containing protein [unclassified Clostridium]MDV4151029.1 amidase domain-containing protein [Clostridium sp. AL.422]
MKSFIKNKKIKSLLLVLIIVLVLVNTSIYNKFILVEAKKNSNNYNRELAREYAIKWAMSVNKKYYNYINDGGDCTNFVSQVLRAGGMEFVGTKKNATSINSWFYYSSDLPNRTSTWTSANAFNLHFGKEGKRVYKYREYKIEDALKKWDDIYSSIYAGDIVQYSRPNNIAFHSQAITDVIDNDTIYFSQHSNSIENFYKNGNLKYYLLGKPNDYNLLVYNIKEEKSLNNGMRNKALETEKNYNKELKEAIEIIRISIEDTRFDNKDYKNEETDEFINKMEKRVEDIELQMNMRSRSSKELLESLMDRNGL